jgi:23S rRNA pseudouridine1911/1915/1917 synthase
MQLTVLFEDNHLLAVAKPAGLPTMGVATDKPSLLAEAKHYIKEKYAKAGNVYLGIVSRLDAPVTGVVLIARTSKAAARLTAQFRDHAVDKSYWALVEGHPEPAADELHDWVRKDERHRRMHIAAAANPEAREARLRYTTQRRMQRTTLLEVALLTGRKHQIRLQLAHHGWPVVGDRKYGATSPWPSGIALHARQLTLTHPVRQTRLVLTAPLPDSWRKAGIFESTG